MAASPGAVLFVDVDVVAVRRHPKGVKVNEITGRILIIGVNL
jgi:hypothetical protein